jgi:hypothetical protein
MAVVIPERMVVPETLRFVVVALVEVELSVTRESMTLGFARVEDAKKAVRNHVGVVVEFVEVEYVESPRVQGHVMPDPQF